MFRNLRKFSTLSIKNVVKHEYDALVIGAGGAGLRATMGLQKKGITLLVYLNYFLHVLILLLHKGVLMLH